MSKQYQIYSFRLNRSNPDENDAYKRIEAMRKEMGTEEFPSGIREAIVELVVYPGRTTKPENLTSETVEKLVESKLDSFGRWLLDHLRHMGVMNQEVIEKSVPQGTKPDEVDDAFFDSLLDDFNRN